MQNAPQSGIGRWKLVFRPPGSLPARVFAKQIEDPLPSDPVLVYVHRLVLQLTCLCTAVLSRDSIIRVRSVISIALLPALRRWLHTVKRNDRQRVLLQVTAGFIARWNTRRQLYNVSLHRVIMVDYVCRPTQAAAAATATTAVISRAFVRQATQATTALSRSDCVCQPINLPTNTYIYPNWPIFNIYCESKNETQYSYTYIWEIFTDLLNCFTETLVIKLAIKLFLEITPVPKCVATLPCKY